MVRVIPVDGHARLTPRGRLAIWRDHRRHLIDVRGLSSQYSRVRGLKTHLLEGRFTVLSASKGELSKAQNQERSDRLANDLWARGFKFWEAEGSYNGAKERSFVITDPRMTEAEAVWFGQRYDQETVLHNAMLLRQDRSVMDRFDPARTIFGEAALDQPFYTWVKVPGAGGIAFTMRA